METQRSEIYGIVAAFEEPEQVVEAARKARAEGYRRMDAYTPMPVHGLAEALHFRDNRVPWAIFFGGIAGATTGYLMQWWISAVDYPLDVGGRPFHSWPSFIPVTFEMTILFAGLTAFFVMLGLNGLPKPYHPIFSAEGFEHASQDQFFLCIEAVDPKFNVEQTTEFLKGLNPLQVSVVGGPEDEHVYYDPEPAATAAEAQH